jgi:hypothetical protein
MNLSKIMGSMTLRERRMLNEAVKQRIMEADGAAPSMDDLADRAIAANDKYSADSKTENLASAQSAYKAWRIAECQMKLELAYFHDPVRFNGTGKYPERDNAEADFKIAMGMPGELDEAARVAAINAGQAAAKSLEASQPQAATTGSETPETAASSAAEAPAKQSAAAPAAATTPSADSLIGSTLSKDSKVVFELTEEGWKTTLRISEEQILALVIPAVQEELKKQMRAAKGQGDELHIVKSSLKDQGAANKSNELFLKRDGEEFADPVVIPVSKMAGIMKKQSLAYANGTDPNRQDTLADTQRAFVAGELISVGAALVGFKDGGIAGLLVPADKLSGFDDLFGTSNSGKIRSAIQKAQDAKAVALQKSAGKKVKSEYPESFKIPLSWAMDGSIMKYMSDSILRGVGIGKIEFKLTDVGAATGSVTGVLFYTASVKLNQKEIAALKEKLGARTAANASTS